MEINPCYKCCDRTATCHAVCEKYKKWRKMLDDHNDKINKIKHAEQNVRDFKRKSLDREKRRKRKE